jgi:hypothetical protein
MILPPFSCHLSLLLEEKRIVQANEKRGKGEKERRFLMTS